MLMREDRTPDRCSECGGVVDRNGRGVERMLNDGTRSALTIVLYRSEAPR